jgi:hypothetical protein
MGPDRDSNHLFPLLLLPVDGHPPPEPGDQQRHNACNGESKANPQDFSDNQMGTEDLG